MATGGRLRFDDFELDASSGELRRRGRRRRLARQPFEALYLLASRAGEVVGRDELRRHLWGEDTFVDFERGLNFCILRIRRALSDDAKSPRYVETLPRRGYRWIAPVQEVPEEEPVASKKRRRPALALTLFLIVVAVALAALYEARRAPSGPERVLLAVLPFKNLSGDPAQDYLSDGFTEELIAQLGGLDPPRLGVIARTTVERYREGTWDASEVGETLGVAFLVEGSVRRDDERVRITAQLIEVEGGTHLWAESYERNRWGALVVQRDVARAVAQELRLQLLPGEETLPDRAGGHRPEAHDAYLQGRFLLHRGGVEDLNRAVDAFQRAAVLDPDLALAPASLAETYHALVMAGGLAPHEAYPAAREAAFAALEKAPSLAEAHLAAGRVAFWYDWSWEEAGRRFERALELNPSLAAARHDYGWYLIALGRPEAGLAEIEAARRLDPLSPSINVDAGWALIQARRYDEAAEACRRTLELAPGFKEAESCLSWIETLRAPSEESRAALREHLDALLADPGNASPRTLAVYYALLGNEEAALDWLEKAFEGRSPSLVLLAVDPAFDGLRGEERFEQLVEQVGVPDAGEVVSLE